MDKNKKIPCLALLKNHKKPYFCTYCYPMKTLAAKEKLSKIIQSVEQNGVQAENLIEDLKALREIAKMEKDPLVVKLLRFTYEYLQENGAFDVEGQFEEDEEGNRFPVEGIEDQENLVYLLSLLQNAEQKVNREELKDYRDALKSELY
ncbi:MAG: hypothetical protein EBU82_00645 [Flavobacteriia bacterium]|jgi:hypothetical protein|nr:hypothetical protein [Flavobacteriia bacterium]NBP28046.1 hypothetical protein [Flavobacteriia bacterium]